MLTILDDIIKACGLPGEVEVMNPATTSANRYRGISRKDIMTRTDGRRPNQLRDIKITKNYTKYAEGSCLIEFGDTRVICTASCEDGVPPFLKNSGTGWVTAEYGMLPRSCSTRIRRNDASGRVFEIQRLVGRSLRALMDMRTLGERTIKIDCDVIQADGGTRTASITGGFIALALALQKLKKDRVLAAIPLKDYVAAVSVGISKGKNILDLNYEEDSTADMDMNVVMQQRKLRRVPGHGGTRFLFKTQVDDLLKLAASGIKGDRDSKENLTGLKI